MNSKHSLNVKPAPVAETNLQLLYDESILCKLRSLVPAKYRRTIFRNFTIYHIQALKQQFAWFPKAVFGLTLRKTFYFGVGIAFNAKRESQPSQCNPTAKLSTTITKISRHQRQGRPQGGHLPPPPLEIKMSSIFYV